MALTDYRIMVRILAVNGVNAVLRAISRDMFRSGKDVDAVGAKFGKWRVGLLELTGGLGLFERQVMPFEQDDGKMHSVSVVKVLFQPEANQMYWL